MANNNDSIFPAAQGDAGKTGGQLSTEYRENIPDYANEEIDLRDYLDVVLRRKWLILGFLFLVFVSTLIFSLAAEKRYMATGTIEVSLEDKRITKFEEVTEQGLRTQEFISTQVSLLKSAALARRVIQDLNLQEHSFILEKKEKGPGLAGRIKEAVKSLIPKQEGSPGRGLPMEDLMEEKGLLEFVQNNLTITPARDSMIINVSFISPDRRLSQSIVNAYMAQYLDWKMDQKVDSSAKAREYLMQQIDRAKITLEKAEEQQHQFARRAGIVSLDSRLNSVYKQLEETNEALGKAQTELIQKESRYRQALEDGPLNLPGVLNSNLINDLKSEYAKLRSEYENQSEIFHAQYPDVKALKSRMDSIETRIQEESEKIFNSIKHNYMAVRGRVDALERRMAQNQEQAQDLNERATQYTIMEREVQTNKAIYQSLLERAKEIETMTGVSPSNIQVVDRASIPIFPDKPNVRRNLLLAIVLGMMGGIAGAFLVEYFADTITNPEQISERFQIPILGVIPLEKKPDGYALEWIFSNDPRAAMSEALRTSKVSIQLSGSDSAAKCILITSTAPGEGKTTIAANMAQTFAGSGEKVLLIDADLRKPRMHNVFQPNNSNNGHGLSSYLAGVVNKGIVSKTDVENLYFIPCGPIPPNPVELLASSRFARLIQKSQEKFDRIILDGPPHHGFADILVLSRQVGGIILISGLGETTRDGLRHFKRSIINVQGNILGCIVNKINLQQRYGYRSYYKYYRAYNYEYGKDKPKARQKKSEGQNAVLKG